MRITRKAALAAASGAALLALAACGRNEADTAATSAETETPEAAPAPATTTATISGVEMNPSDSIAANASKAPNLTTLVSALQAAGLTERLQGAGPFTVFAPDNAAFEKIPAADRERLMRPEGKADLTQLLTYHVVPGRLTAADLAVQAQGAGGAASLTTVQGDKLTVQDAGGGKWRITDARGGSSTITQADVPQANGVIHVVDTVLMPG